MGAKLKCSTCGREQDAPVHCNRPMHLEKVGGEDKFVCWMGPDCGSAELPKHCGAPMTAAS